MSTLLSINNYYYRRGGAEVVFLEQNRLFEDLGWQVIPFCMKHPRNEATPWEDYFVEEIEFGEAYGLAEKLIRIPKVVYSVEARRKLAALLDRVRPDFCHAHNVYHHISPSILSLVRERGIPLVLTLHDLKIACPAYQMLTHDGICERCKGGRLYEVIRHKCIKNSRALSAVIFLESVVNHWLGSYANNVDRFVSPSRFYLEKLVEWGWSRERFLHVPNFVDAASFAPDYAPGRAFIYLGRLSPEKGLVTLVKAAALADVPVWIAGTGPEEAKLREVIRETGAKAELLGYLTGASLHDAIRSARAVVLPSEWYENAPVSVMEAYALGKPVIGADIGGIPELIREGETGAIFESGNVESLASALRRYCDLPDGRLGDMGRTGRRWMEEDFSSKRYRERLLTLYAELGSHCVPETKSA